MRAFSRPVSVHDGVGQRDRLNRYPRNYSAPRKNHEVCYPGMIMNWVQNVQAVQAVQNVLNDWNYLNELNSAFGSEGSTLDRCLQ